jgi:hypothetical protein
MLTKEIIPEGVIKVIFSNLGEIYQLHQEMLFALEARLMKWLVMCRKPPVCVVNLISFCYRDSDPRIGDVIAKYAPYFKVSKVLLLFLFQFQLQHITLSVN